ncbi:MAG: hypothetical protein ACR2J8_15075, partial [Thermomicrobiales bacterium]
VELPALPEKIRKRQAKEIGAEPAIYKTLVIKPMGRKQTTAEQEANDSADPRRMHVARGHFKTYTTEKPLFGKYTGTYWWDAHVRGDIAAGRVRKTYTVKS